MNSISIAVVVLGCDKNTVDAEHFAGALVRRMPKDTRICALTEDHMAPHDLDAVVIYTCGFIQDAKEESIEAILKWEIRKKETGSPRFIYVAGCLAQRHRAALQIELPEVDGFFGVNDTDRLIRQLCVSITQKTALPVMVNRPAARLRLDAKPYGFLKIADGCNHACSFCVIPGIKGRYRSTPRKALLDEARRLLDSGTREIDLVAQDTTAYGRDLYKNYRLPDLLRDLCALPGDFWIRCLYCYPGGIDDALIHQIASQPKIAPYLDIPLQHTSPRILRAMGRPAAAMDIAALIRRLRAAIPNLTLRTTMMVGFPGETIKDHRHMLNMMEQLAFEWLGAFIFSPEEDTPAAMMAGQLSRRAARRRYEAVMRIQADITEAFNTRRKGETTLALIEHYDADLRVWRGRSVSEAPEVDGGLLIRPDARLRPGIFIKVRIERAALYDATAVVYPPIPSKSGG